MAEAGQDVEHGEADQEQQRDGQEGDQVERHRGVDAGRHGGQEEEEDPHQRLPLVALAAEREELDQDREHP